MKDKVETLGLLLLWGGGIGLPFLTLGRMAWGQSDQQETMAWGQIYSHSIGLAALLSMIALVLGWWPARLWSRLSEGQGLWLWILLMPLMLPRHLLYYAWSLLLSPSHAWGRWLSQDPDRARLLGQGCAGLVLVLWTWPLAALILGLTLRRLDGQVWEQARMDASPGQVFWRVTFPLLGRPILLAYLFCFVFLLADFATFHLSGWQTVGTELAVLYQLTGSAGVVFRAAWPMIALAVLIAMLLTWIVQQPQLLIDIRVPKSGPTRGLKLFVIGLLIVSVGCPLTWLMINLQGVPEWQEILALYGDVGLWSGIIALIAASLAFTIALLCVRLAMKTRWGGALYVPVFSLMLIPGSLVGVAILHATVDWPNLIRQSWGLIAWGLSARFAGVAVVILCLLGCVQSRQCHEAAEVDGARTWPRFRFVTWPQTWPIMVVTVLVVGMFAMTELAATMVLLPAGLPNFSQSLLNQMHYARDQQTIVACLLLVAGLGVTSLLAIAIGGGLGRIRILGRFGALILVCLVIGGCEPSGEKLGVPDVLYSFGRTGRGPAEFMYPRAIAAGENKELLVIDKTGRIQRFDHRGGLLGSFRMPKIEAGKPTGLKVGPDQRIYVADTHYHRVLIVDLEGTILSEFGSLGEEAGCFIYPTDVAFNEEGQIFVSEYGGNDRISVFDSQGQFQYAFGSPEEGPLVLSRPAALCIDEERDELYIADACQHRIVVVTYSGDILRVIGELGQAPGQLRYPYDMTLLPDRRLVVCEFGNNRIQVFDEQGQSQAIYGDAGRDLGQLAYPWGVTVDKDLKAYIVDAGNNRIQVWQL